MSSKAGMRAVASDVDADAHLPTETVFQTLGHRRRRHTLHYLRRRNGPVSIRELSAQLAAWELGKPCEVVTPKERKRLYTALHQTHLPKMDTLGVVEYDRGTVSLTDQASDFDIYLDVVSQNDLPWSQFYLALGAVFTALVTVAALGVAPFTAVSGFGYALGVSAVVLFAAAYHTVRDRQLRIGSSERPPDALSPATESLPADDD